MKVIKISEETHQYLMLQRVLTGVPAGRQIDILVKKEQENDPKSSKNEAKDT